MAGNKALGVGPLEYRIPSNVSRIGFLALYISGESSYTRAWKVFPMLFGSYRVHMKPYLS